MDLAPLVTHQTWMAQFNMISETCKDLYCNTCFFLSLSPLSLSPIQILELLHNSDNSIEALESIERTTSSSNLQTRVNQSPTPGLASLVSGPGDGCCRNRLADGAGTGGRLRLGRELLAHGHLGCP